jgi:TM2 domain-containing membrane protein YozV
MKGNSLSATPPPPPIHEIPAPNMHVDCPYCQVRLSVHPSQAGSAAGCPKCGGRFQLPIPTALPLGRSQLSAYSSTSEIQRFASKKITAGICGILLGGFGVHKFILGFGKAGAIMLTVWLAGIVLSILILPLFASAAMWIIGLIEGIIYLTKSDEDFYQAYAVEKKEWF